MVTHIDRSISHRELQWGHGYHYRNERPPHCSITAIKSCHSIQLLNKILSLKWTVHPEKKILSLLLTHPYVILKMYDLYL